MNLISTELRDGVYKIKKGRDALSDPIKKELSKLSQYRYAREAFFDILIRLGFNQEKTVLMPEFICSDMLQPLDELKVNYLFYSCPEDLLSFDSSAWPKADMVMAVNYFGVPQKLQPFEDYCQRNSALLVEDNAHSFFSCDSEGVLLGTRADFGLFSFRKVFPECLSSGLYIRPGIQLNPLSRARRSESSSSSYLKIFLRQLPSSLSRQMIFSLAQIKRKLFPLKEPGPVEFFKQDPVNFLEYLNDKSLFAEGESRRELYECLHKVLTNQFPIKPIFPKLDDQTIPFGFAYRCDQKTQTQVLAFLNQMHLESFSWPTLPSLTREVPDYYKNVYIVRFKW